MKMYELAVFQLLFTLCNYSYAQNNNWYYQYPGNTSNTINSFLILPDSKILLGADAGRLLELDNNMIVNMKQISDYNIICLEGTDPGIIYCLTYSNYLYDFKNQILKSADNGETWKVVYSGHQYLRDMCVIDSLNIIAVGNDSKIIISSDGGEIWNTCDL